LGTQKVQLHDWRAALSTAPLPGSTSQGIDLLTLV
jgi:hypothetical protein